MKAKVYGVPASHPVRGTMLMLAAKGIDAKRRDLPNILVRPMLRMLGFAEKTVPAVRIDGRRLQTSKQIARALDEIRPSPPLFPADPDARAAVEAAETWGDETLQPVVRRLAWAALKRDRSGLRSFLDGPLLGIPPAIAAATAGPLVAASVKLNGATDDAARADLAALPAMLDQVDDLIANGVIGQDPPNAADFQIAPSVGLLLCFEDLRPAIEGRPAETLARRVAGENPGEIPAVFPADWVPAARAR